MTHARDTIATALLTALAIALLGAGTAQARNTKVFLKVVTRTQHALLHRTAVTVRVRTTGKVRVRLSTRHRGLFDRKWVRVKTRKGRSRRVTLHLTARGRTRFATCGAKKIRVIGSYHKRYRRKATVRARARLAGDARLCGAPPPRPPVTPRRATCDPLDPATCLQPFPDDYYTRPDASTPTGLRLDFPAAGMPANRAGVRVDPTDINRGDGFSPGTPIVTKIPGVDNRTAFAKTGFVPETDMHEYSRPDQPVVVYDTTTHRRWPVWAELDSNPTTVAPYQAADGIGGINTNPFNTGPVNLIVRPARNFTPGHTYVVALRNLEDARGRPVEAQTPFRTCRDGLPTDDPALRYRCDDLDKNVFPELARDGIARKGLYLAWQFTIASEQSLTGRALQIRNDAFRRLGDDDLADRSLGDSVSPTVEVTHACGGGYTDCSTNDGADGLPPQPGPHVYRYVDGFIRNVPCYLNADGCPPTSSFALDPDGTVKVDPAFTTDVPFRCLIPASANDGGTASPGRAGLFGHGLLGSYAQISFMADLADENDQTWCATNWFGFSAPDLAVGVLPTMRDLSGFHAVVDRMQQGFVNVMMLGRAAIHPGGMATKPEFRIGGRSVIDVSRGKQTRLLYMGISQGAIMGAALTALEPDVDDSVLSVPGMNYSTLLRRSVDFDAYASLPALGLWANYPDEAVRPLGLGMIQSLWDRGEGDGYAANLRAGHELPDTPPHQVLLQLAVGDQQVSNVAAEVEARTIGATLYAPAVNPGRHWDVDPFMDITRQAPPIAGGNTMVYYDGGPPGFSGTIGQGSGVEPALNVPPRPEWGFGGDAHYYPWQSPDGRDQESSFLNGDGVSACRSGGYCYSNGWTGPSP